MRKEEFLNTLRANLSDLPKREIDERLNFYSEIIDDKMEDGSTEEDAVKEIGTVKKISNHILSEHRAGQAASLNVEKANKKRRLTTLQIILIILGSPVWISLIASAAAVMISIYATLLSVVISLWSVVVALLGGGLIGTIIGLIFIFSGSVTQGLFYIGAGLVSLGLLFPAFLGCLYATKGIFRLAKVMTLSIKKLI